MQRFPCPFCGLRDETEFHFVTEADKPRPEPAETTSDRDWADYLHAKAAAAGSSHEIWLHRTCGEYFILARNTLTREVHGSEALPGATT